MSRPFSGHQIEILGEERETEKAALLSAKKGGRIKRKS
jgi:hypothetical protein